MDMDKIMLKLQKEHCNIFAKARRKFVFDEKAHYKMRNYLDGFDYCYKMLEELIKEESQNPPCSGSSVQNKDKILNNDKFGIFIGDIVELKDGTIGELILVEKTEGAPNLYNLGVECKYNVFHITLTSSQFKDYFNRIGNNDFNKKDNIDKLKLDFKKVTEPATITTVDGKGNVTLEFNKMADIYHKILPTNEEIMNKINEIIDYINKEDK